MAKPGQRGRSLVQVDALAANPGVGAIGQKGDPQGALGDRRKAGDAGVEEEGFQHCRCP